MFETNRHKGANRHWYLFVKNSPRGVLGGISGNCKGGGEIREVKGWLGGKCSFQCHKGIIARAVPQPGMSFLGKVKEGWVVSE